MGEIYVDYGVMVYSDEENDFVNVGDYIQSIACCSFLSPNVYINREKLDAYSGNPTKMIMNGWYMDHPEHWPPSKSIEPLFVAFHMEKNCKESMLSPEGISYLKQHAPIGCRDKDTLSYLAEHNIPSYFSGCLTLTLGLQYHHQNSGHKIFIVDPYLTRYPLFKNVLDIISVVPKHYRVISIISKKMGKNNCHYVYYKKNCSKFERFLHAALFYKTYSPILDDELMVNAEYLTHTLLRTDYANDSEIFTYARNLLNDYSTASLVITSRLHCALPCLAMGTPCIFVSEDHLKNDGRFNGLYELLFSAYYSRKLRHIDPSGLIQFDNKKINLDTSVPIPNLHWAIVQNLIYACSKFVNK